MVGKRRLRHNGKRRSYRLGVQQSRSKHESNDTNARAVDRRQPLDRNNQSMPTHEQAVKFRIIQSINKCKRLTQIEKEKRTTKIA